MAVSRNLASRKRPDRRALKRKFTHEFVDMYHEGQLVGTYALHDISRGGVFLELDDTDLKVNNHVELRFPLPRDATFNQKVLCARGTVVRIEERGLAIELNERHFQDLKSMLDTVIV